MKKRLVLSLIFAGFFYSTYFAQFSAYGSVSYGFNQNPLYNYENKSDQLKQTYLEMNYQKDFDYSLLKFSYVSGLMLFNEFSDRNFYEHNFYTRYSVKLSKSDNGNTNDREVSEKESNEADNEESDSDSIKAVQPENVNIASEDNEADSDSSGSYLDLMAKIGARHDKDIFKEFDNFGSDVLASCKFMPAESFSIRVTNDFGLRNYTNIQELSNVSDILTLQIANKFNRSYSYGVRLSGAYKYYTSTVYDTTKYENQRSYKKNPGKGKGGAAVTVPSGKGILIEPQANGTSQLSAGLFFIKMWESSSLETNLTYRYNPNTQTRYLAQHSNAGLNEDIYNDFFSYQGFEAGVKYNRPLFWGMQIYTEISLEKKNFEAPALNLNGDQISAHREDIHTSAEVMVTKSLPLFGSTSLELIAGGGILRNQSNDDYNDFSSFSLSGGIGIGF